MAGCRSRRSGTSCATCGAVRVRGRRNAATKFAEARHCDCRYRERPSDVAVGYPPSADNLLHPIDTIYVISPASPAIRQLCDVSECAFIDETQLLPDVLSQIFY